jgi:ketosteroid isomerase-like protein
MGELDDFLTPTLTRQLEAEKALINGDPGSRLAMWSTQEPVTVLGAMKTVIGSEETRQVFRWLVTRFSNLTDDRFELVAAGASGDLAYTVGYEHTAFSLDGAPVAPSTLRVTHVYRREDGEWKIVHRHADAPRPVSSLALTHRPRRRFGQTQTTVGPPLAVSDSSRGRCGPEPVMLLRAPQPAFVNSILKTR